MPMEVEDRPGLTISQLKPDREMAMPALLTALVAWSLLRYGAGLALDRRQARAIRTHRDAVPAAFSAAVSPDDHRKAADYGLARLRLGALSGLLDLVAGVVALVWGFDWVSGLVSARIAPSVGRSLVIFGVIWLASGVLSLPVAAWRTLVLEQRYGFNRRSPGLFLRDTLVGSVLGVAIGAPVLGGILWAMRALNGSWWIWAWAALTLAMLAAPTIHVRFVAPLFNRFTPLRAEIAEPVEALMARAGFRSGGLFEMDASKRSSRGNAYFIGFGPTKRIVLFDTLIDAHTSDEIQAVVAHELGHFHYRHTLTGLLRGIVFLFGVMASIGWLSRQPWLLPGFGIHHPDPALSLLLAMLVAGSVSPLLGVAGNALSRRHEFQADAFARRMVGAAPMISALTRLARDNAATLTPDRLFSLVHDTHPPVPLRVARLLSPGR
jgi:STE24 endopeptidase